MPSVSKTAAVDGTTTTGLGADPGMNNDIPISLKAVLVDDRGLSYRDFRRTLTPRFARVWRDIALGYAGLAVVVTGLGAWDPGLPAGLLAATVGSIVIGYVLAYLNNFFHEAAHHNLMPDRRRNDIATNLLMGWIFGSSIATYRQIHFQHHRPRNHGGLRELLLRSA
jgi:fatty acid desaturase